MNKLKIAVTSVVSVMLFSFGVALAYAFPLEPTPVQMQKNFIECLEQNLTNSNHDCFTRLTRR